MSESEAAGYTSDDFPWDSPVLQRFVPDEQERVAASISRILNGERLTAEEFTVLRKDGTTFPSVLVYANPVVHDDKVVGIREWA